MTTDGLERAALVALLRNSKDLGLTQAEIRARLDRGETPSDVLAKVDDDGLFARDTQGLVAGAAERIGAWERAGERFVTYFEPDYPQQLATAFDYPFVLFYAGALQDDFRSLAIVGRREPTAQSTDFAR